MHEMALSESLLAVLEEQATQHGYARVKTVWLEIGPLAGVEVESLRFSFEVVSRGTLAEGAALEIEDTGESCGATSSNYADACPGCGGYALRVSGGDDMRIKELEVE